LTIRSPRLQGAGSAPPPVTPSHTVGLIAMNEAQFSALRERMLAAVAIHATLAGEEIGKAMLDQRVMEVMARVPRHEFVPVELQPFAYENMPLPIGFGKTISQPFIVALMTDLLDPQAGEVVLEIGTGLGYQAAILAELVERVWSVEIVEELATEAEKRLRRRGYRNVGIRIGDGSAGWGEHAPFDKIMVCAAPELVPPALIHQLKRGGRMVLPAGLSESQRLIVVDKDQNGRTRTKEMLAVRFAELETIR
jgi:protein-L-isoaspartate(D-aspartate) O-methyltransferase